MKNYKNEITNITFLLSSALERAVKVLEGELGKEKLTYRHDMKRNYNMIVTDAKRLKHSLDRMNEAANCLNGENFDALWEDANYICRIIMLICDRTNKEHDKMYEIEEFISNMPEKGIIDNQFIKNNFTLK